MTTKNHYSVHGLLRMIPGLNPEGLPSNPGEREIVTVSPCFSPDDTSFTLEDMRFTPEDIRFTSEDVLFTSEDIRFTAEDVLLTSEDIRFTPEDVLFTSEDIRFTPEDVLFTSEDIRFTPEVIGSRKPEKFLNPRNPGSDFRLSPLAFGLELGRTELRIYLEIIVCLIQFFKINFLNHLKSISMSTNRKSSQKDQIRLFNIAFTNALSNPAISEKLTEAGLNSEYLAEGKKLLEQTESLIKDSKSERIKLAEASELLNAKREALEKTFSRHRRLARIIFSYSKVIRDKLSISGKYPVTYGSLISTVSGFYDTLSNNLDLLQKLSRFNITEKEVQEGHQMVEELVTAYAFYTNLKGESQKTTDLKDYSLEKIKSWMSDFYAVARIAFSDHPQQLESFGIVVK